MLRHIASASFLSFAVVSIGQNTFPWPATGQVGIGTTTPFGSYLLHLDAPALPSPTGEPLMRATVNDSPDQHLSINNVTSLNGTFFPMLWGGDERPTPAAGTRHGGLYLRGNVVDDVNDAGTLSPLMVFNGILNYNSVTGTSNPVVIRPLFSWTNQFATMMLMSANGNLGIGTGGNVAPTARLHTNGTLRFQGLTANTYTSALVVDASGNVATRAWPGTGATLSCSTVNFVPKVTGTNVLNCSQIWDNGTLVNINSTSTVVANPSVRFRVNGNMQVNSTYYTSDQRVKQDVKRLNGSLEKVMRLNPVSYNWNKAARPGFEFDDQLHLGFLAQELEKVVPAIVATDSEGYKAINYTELVPLLVASMQDQSLIIEDKQSQIDALNERLAVLEGKSTENGQMEAVGTKMTRLEQNAPNPFTENTIIRYNLAEKAGQCSIDVLDIGGKVVKSFKFLGSGSGQLLLEAGSLPAGTYTYALFVAGKSVDSKIMVVTH